MTTIIKDFSNLNKVKGARTTIKIEDLKTKVNNSLKSINLSNIEKDALANLLESILIENKCYKGFMFLDSSYNGPTYLNYARKYL